VSCSRSTSHHGLSGIAIAHCAGISTGGLQYRLQDPRDRVDPHRASPGDLHLGVPDLRQHIIVFPCLRWNRYEREFRPCAAETAHIICSEMRAGAPFCALIGANAVTTAKIAASNVTHALIQNERQDRPISAL
jgi:hypothetical protein